MVMLALHSLPVPAIIVHGYAGIRQTAGASLYSTSFNIHTSPGDGHCFFHFLLQCLNMCMPDMGMLFFALKSIFKSETMSISHIYTPIYRDASKTQLFAEMKLYVNNKIFKTLFGDLVPLVMANALESNVIVIKKQVNGGHNMHIIPPSIPAQININIVVYKTGEHYDGCLPKSSARVESVIESHLKPLPLAENIHSKERVNPNPPQSNQQLPIFSSNGRSLYYI